MDCIIGRSIEVVREVAPDTTTIVVHTLPQTVFKRTKP
jgi:hypothetical protein